MKLPRISTLHKWLSLIVGIQVLIWLGTGLYFNLSDAQKATGNALRQAVDHRVDVSPELLLPISALAVTEPRSIRLIHIAGQPVYQVLFKTPAHRAQKQDMVLLNAVTGAPYELTAEQAVDIARRSYTGTAENQPPQFIQPPVDALPGYQNPLWQINFVDDQATSVFISIFNGRVVAHINDDRRLRDLMFKLHFMDYFNQGGFNHWLIIVFATVTLGLAITGAIWTIQLIGKGQLFTRRRGRRRA